MQDLTYKVPQKQAPLKEKPYKNKEYLAWLHNQGLNCLVCPSQQIELHHIQQGAKGRADNEVVPLCPWHHRGKYSPHGAEKREFELEYMDIMQEKALLLFKKFTNEKTTRKIN